MKILITGGTGSLGRALTKRFLSLGHEIFIYSRDEGKHALFFHNMESVTCDIGDVRDLERLKSVIKHRQPEVVVHTAALKRIDDLEFSPKECFKTNVDGTANVIDACVYGDVATLISVSTDKAVQPVNCYGASKLMAERIVVNAAREHKSLRFASVRYGNVIASRGSFIPLWMSLIKSEKFVPVTSFDCTRFLFTLDDAVDVVLAAIRNAEVGEIYVPKMDSFSMSNVIATLEEITKKKARTTIIGMRPGEKLHEQIVGDLEASRTQDDGRVMRILPEALDRCGLEERLWRQRETGPQWVPLKENKMSSDTSLLNDPDKLFKMIKKGLEIASSTTT